MSSHPAGPVPPAVFGSRLRSTPSNGLDGSFRFPVTYIYDFLLLQVAATATENKLKTIVGQGLTHILALSKRQTENHVTSSTAVILSAIVLTAFGVVGVVAGVVWRRRGYHIPAFIRVVGLVLSALGVWLVLHQTAQLREWSVVRVWPSVDGVVVASRVAGERAFHPEIVYEYSVAGSTYRDSTSFDTPSFGGRSSKRNVAEAIVANFPVGSPVRVHYDPALPSRSLLRITPDWSHFGKIGLGGVLLGVGLFLIAAGRARTR